MTAANNKPRASSERADKEVERHKRQTLAGSYLERALAELRASGSSDTLYPPSRMGVRVSRPLRGALGKRIAQGRRREAARSAVLFAILAAEAYANQYLQIHLTGAEADAADRLPTFEKFIMGPQLVRGEKVLDRGAEPAQTLKKLLDQRSALVHPKLAPPGSDGPTYTPEEAACFIVAVADAAGWLFANSDPRPKFDLTMATVDQERGYFLEYGRKATERLPEIDDDPAPDLVITIWSRQTVRPAARTGRSVPQRCHSRTRINRLQPDSAGRDLALRTVFRSSKRRVGPLSSL